MNERLAAPYGTPTRRFKFRRLTVPNAKRAKLWPGHILRLQSPPDFKAHKIPKRRRDAAFGETPGAAGGRFTCGSPRHIRSSNPNSIAATAMATASIAVSNVSTSSAHTVHRDPSIRRLRRTSRTQCPRQPSTITASSSSSSTSLQHHQPQQHQHHHQHHRQQRQH